LSGRAREAGFSLVELVVASAVLLVALAIAADLLSESLRRFSVAGRSLVEADEENALARLRGDLRALEPVSPGDGRWSVLPLVLADEARAVAWAYAEGGLVRSQRALDGSFGAAPLLDGVVAFRWRVDPPGWVEVEITRRTPERLAAWHLASAQWKRRDERVESVTIGIATRRGWR
jgi:prepilin-type N-terminal cleavage/methylation domain-containing protein